MWVTLETGERMWREANGASKTELCKEICLAHLKQLVEIRNNEG